MPNVSLNAAEMERLARFNTEKYHGIVHEASYVSEMVELQRRFNRYNSQFTPVKTRRVWLQRERVITQRCERCGVVFPYGEIHGC